LKDIDLHISYYLLKLDYVLDCPVKTYLHILFSYWIWFDSLLMMAFLVNHFGISFCIRAVCVTRYTWWPRTLSICYDEKAF